MVKPLSAHDPARIGPYRLIGLLGQGGMGRVYLARSLGGRLLAVKVISGALAGDRSFRRRFAAEIAAARKVGGFYTAQVVDAATEADPPWLATAYCAGPSLQEAVDVYGPLSGEAVEVLGAGLAEGLAAIHARELVHRDLKPGNVILAEDGPRVIDFGIARALDAAHLSTTVIGTPGYMAPEQVTGAPAGTAADVFSLGCLLVFAATGHGPYGEGPTEAIVYRVVHGEPHLWGLPPRLAPLVTACLAKDPAARPTVGEILRGLSVPPQATLALPEGVTAMIAERGPARLLSETGGAETLVPEAAAAPRRRGLFGGLGLAAVLVAILLVSLINGGGDPGAAGGPGITPTTSAPLSRDPCDVTDEQVRRANRLTTTGTPDGYSDDKATVRTCTWKSELFSADARLSFTLIYASAVIELIDGPETTSADLAGLPADTVVRQTKDETACVVAWLTRRGQVAVYGRVAEPTGVLCDLTADFARSVLAKLPA
ncbi:hypothetical protein Afil01_29460 [Actinorhabdospora filicis]|uniref:non-specific serine/threonine protein kinase n=1 Tax=Actinorhabdospora filicis TaxID=1785913 RepID=A0A9W6W925_9ACTN|nr:serine/threonine-protein kinase [Actinorhabdospora filicis]GLZ78139.1 hypothetical protein Afil01_29460 [Actinorhabdospora filicis]